MNSIFKKVSFRCVSLVLGITLFANGVFAMDPKINEAALMSAFRDQYHKKSRIGSSGFNTNPSDAYSGENSLCYIQEANTYGGEKRKVYVWNLPGAVGPDSGGFCSILLYCINTASNRLNEGIADKWIEDGEALKRMGKTAIGTEVAAEVVKSTADLFGVSSEKLVSWFIQGMNVLGISDNAKFGDILCKGLDKISKKFPSDSKLSVIKCGTLVLGALTIAVGVIFTMEGVAKLNEEARNIADAEKIIDDFLELVFAGRYRNANVLVMAKDVSKLHFHNWDSRGEPPFIGFWKHDGLCECGAPIFEVSWTNLTNIPQWASAFIIELDRGVDRLADKRKALEDAKKSLDKKSKLYTTLPGGSKRLIEGGK